jgi:formylglycine-generating enzyme required for sulfatase activity/serine/threonine protein kinase
MEQIGRFRILGRLGGGGFGEVFLAEDSAMGRKVAIKIFRPRDENVLAFATSTDEEALQILRERFLSEARILASLEDEPYVVNVHEYGQADDGAPYYVMPYLPHSLADELGRDLLDFEGTQTGTGPRPRALPMNRTLKLAEQLLAGLAAAHGRGLIHRDIKPSNIMLSTAGEVRIVDFGIAKIPDSVHSTVSHLGIGSRNYMAPEQRESAKHVDARADIYAAGVVIYRTLTGRLPVGRFADPITLVPALGQPMNDLLLAMMAINRDQRPRDGVEALTKFRSALAEVGQDDPEVTRPWRPEATTEVVSPASRDGRGRSGRLVGLLLALFVAVVLGSGGVWYWRESTPPDAETLPDSSSDVVQRVEPPRRRLQDTAFADDFPVGEAPNLEPWAETSADIERLARTTSRETAESVPAETPSQSGATAIADESAPQSADPTVPESAGWEQEPPSRAQVSSATSVPVIDPREQARFELIGRIQGELQRLGREIQVDGVLGSNTARHIRAFEEAAGLPETGQPNAALLTRLEAADQWPTLEEVVEVVESPGQVWEPGQVFHDCSDCPKMVVVPPGTFTMGSPGNERQRRDSEGPQREVTIRLFALGVHPVTFAEFDACFDDGGCSNRPYDRNWGRGNRPLVNVTWDDAQEYVRWLSATTGEEYRLPSEAEWEYAARAGTTTRFNTGDCITREQAAYNGLRQPRGCIRDSLSNRPDFSGTYPPNAWGLYDMHGNVADWVADCWNDNYRGAPTDGSAWLRGRCDLRIQRGGNWYQSGDLLRSASRVSSPRDYSNFYLGFRVARSLD